MLSGHIGRTTMLSVDLVCPICDFDQVYDCDDSEADNIQQVECPECETFYSFSIEDGEAIDYEISRFDY